MSNNLTEDQAKDGGLALEHPGLPVHGYQSQPKNNVDQVNLNKQTEERLLRLLDLHRDSYLYDQHWLAIARTHFEEGFMAMNRAVFQPKRISLPEDTETNG